MIAVVFEVKPTEQGRDEYLELASNLKKLLEKQTGCISVERFESLVEKGKLLSLSFWEDEASIATWRNILQHRRAQESGRNTLFDSYRIRVAKVVRDYTNIDRTRAPEDSNKVFL